MPIFMCAAVLKEQFTRKLQHDCAIWYHVGKIVFLHGVVKMSGKLRIFLSPDVYKFGLCQ